MTNRWYYALDGRAFGPVSTAEIKRLAADGQLPPHTLLWPEGSDASQAIEVIAAIDVKTAAVAEALPAWLSDVQRSELSAPPQLATTPAPAWVKDVRRVEEAEHRPTSRTPLPPQLEDTRGPSAAPPVLPAPPTPSPRRKAWWPQSQDYNEMMQAPALSFTDPELRQGAVAVNALGLPRPHSGNFADVYELISPGGMWAIKCFTRQVPGLRERYAAISACLRQANLPFMVDFAYLDPGIQVRGLGFPVLKMNWVEGIPLNEFVRRYLDQPRVLAALCDIWQWLARRLRKTGIAHGDLQHGNVLLRPETQDHAQVVKLIDYDGMYVPALAQHPSGELGHPAYQHPQRVSQAAYGPEADRFSHLVIYTAMRSLVAGGRALWERHDNGDNLLFRPGDFRAPAQSPLFEELLHLDDPEVRRLAATLSDVARKPLDQVPLLDDVISGKLSASG